MGTLSIATLLKLIPPISTKLVIDYVLTENARPAWMQQLSLPEGRLGLLFAITAAAIGISFVATMIHLWGRWIATKTVNQIRVHVRRKVFDHAVRLPLNRVFDLKSGGASSLLREDAGGVADLVFSMLYNPWRAILQLIGSLCILITVDWRMMVGGILMLPLVYITHRTWISRIRPLYRDVRSQRQLVDSQSTEAFGGMRVVRAFSREKSETHRFVVGNHMLVRQQLHVWWWARIVEVVWDIFIPICSTGLLLYGGYQIINSQMTLGDLMLFLFYLAMLLEPLATLANTATSFQNNLAGLDRVLDVLAEDREMPPSENSVNVSRATIEGRIELENVSFQYPNSKQMVLEDISFEAEAGQTIAFVGKSGAGKTTLCNLIARFYDPTHGTIRLDGRDLRDIHIDSYRKLLGIVEQDVFLFDGTIADNIAYGSNQATQSDVEYAAEAAYVAEFINGLDKGYQTIIGERGVKLSGGQRQRIAIARAILANPRILILDEATSNLDSESERYIQSSLKELMANRTSFVIAHRLSTITNADAIIVLDEGRIVEIGRHHELLERNGPYRGMVDLQMNAETL